MNTIISILALVISACTFLFNVYHTRRRDTLDAFNRLQAEVFDDLNTYTPKKVEEISKNRRTEEYKKLTAYLVRIEQFCAGVNTHIYSKTLLKRITKGYIHIVYIKLEPLITEKNKVGSGNYYKEFEKVQKDL